ncbi:MAG: hypothetical protein A2428_15895 [Bdellovibrionales bacterium RIFOXYC1_FULL_54_43]|nr:MAG: hypothetical protein A2428_15895 [Bdellovibrionales bacterium RIFOXYC1_FULL_54_43]OFZ82955.1 MAG: hypothetical protein A2603_11045 [Bdellovibrionales bacterium RIFOXYD1_FULL_55_31]
MISKFRYAAFAVLCAIGSITPPDALALISSEATLSSGLFRNSADDLEVPVFFYWNLDYTGSSGVQTYFDVGANNNLILNSWGFYLYQGFVTVPLWEGFETAPYRKSRLLAGRQLLTEGFELSLLDGLQAPFYWSDKGGGTLLAGALSTLQEKQVDFSSEIYGGSLHQDWLGATWKTGFLHKRHTYPALATASRNLSHGSVFWSFEKIPLTPMLHTKAQFDLDSKSYDQGLAEATFYPVNSLSFGAMYSKRQPSPFDPKEAFFIYRLFALSPELTTSAFATWAPEQDLRFQLAARRTTFGSPTGQENGFEQEISATWFHARSTWTPSLVHLRSYGGEFWQPALAFRKDLSDVADLRFEFAAAHIDKINGIKNWAYHTRGGVNYRFQPRLQTLGLAELQRNHLYSFDFRFIMFLSYLLF